jgi:hypothetical protein
MIGMRLLMSKLQLGLLSLALALAWTAPAHAQASQKPTSDESVLVGDWRGDSICQVRPSACHDEDSLYHFAKVDGKPGAYSLKADKIVNGQPETMGTLDCAYDAKAQALECSIPDRATLRFTWEGKEMRGTMTLTDKTLWRKLSLKKVEPKKTS